MISISELWKKTTGSKDVKVGIIDTGIQAEHPDLRDNVKIDISYNLNDGKEIYEHPKDESGHGTHIAGVIGAVGNNNEGITGVCWNVGLVSLKVFKGTETQTTSSRIVTAIDLATHLNIKLLNFSGESNYFDDALRSTVVNYRGLFICSAGTRDVNFDNIRSYPAVLSSYSHVITVAASNEKDKLSTEDDWEGSKGSNYGEKTVDLFASGSNILSTYPTNLSMSGYSIRSGSSVATAYVTGVAALMLSLYPDMNPSAIKQNILQCALEINGLKGLCKTGARLDVNRGFSVLDLYVVAKEGNNWRIRVTNPTNKDVEVIYNSKLCWDRDAKNWTDLKDICTVDVPSQGSCEVIVTPNGYADYLAFSYINGNIRFITYTTNLAVRQTISCYYNTVPAYSYRCLKIVGKNNTIWKIRVTNNISPLRVKVEYNQKMCNLEDARDWTSALKDLATPFYLEYGESKVIDIQENWSAAYIGISLTDDFTQTIYYANELNPNTTMSVNTNVRNVYKYLQLKNLGKVNGKWQIQVTNPTNDRIIVQYNNKMCNEGDAKNWTGLNDVDDIEILGGQSKPVYVSTNWFATCVAFSYERSDGIRVISYANGLGSNGSINVMYNYK